VSGEHPTPPMGTPTIPADEQARYDAGQDARAQVHTAQLQALRSDVAALVGRSTPSMVQWPRVITAVLTAAMVSGLGAQVMMRDTVRDNAVRITALERAHQETALEMRGESARRLTDDRSSRDQLAAIQSDLRALRVQVDLALSQRTDEPDDTPRRRHR
jgi:hypothetical protein